MNFSRCFYTTNKSPISIATIRREHKGGLRLWENNDIVPRPDDVFQERLYCIRWMESITNSSGSQQVKWHFCAPDKFDLEREKQVLLLLKECFSEWQEKGYIPSMKIEEGEKTSEPIRTRGWTYWHHLFTPRQLLYHSILLKDGLNTDFKFASAFLSCLRHYIC